MTFPQIMLKGLRHHPYVAVGDDLPVAVVGKTGAFLPPVLQGKKAVKELLGKVQLLPGGDPHDAAVVAE
jgi:hypothetical protein